MTSALGVINSSRSDKMPEGHTHLSWNNMVSKFQTITKANLILN
jgi:hypothetical protein